MSVRARLLIAVVSCVLLAAGCSDDGGGNAAPASSPAIAGYPNDDTLRLNDLQVLGSHNSYHVEAEPKLLAAIRAFDPATAVGIEYGHVPLDEQFSEEGIRQIELDVFADPDGGLYANPAGPGFVGESPPSDPDMSKPGFKVLHVQDIDYRSTCATLVRCLTVVRDWSRAHPGHAPMMILIEAKEDVIPDPGGFGFVVPHPIGPAEFDALDAEIRSVFDANEMITPDDVRGNHASLEEAIKTDGWPTLRESRGKVLFALDNEGGYLEKYIAGHRALQGRVLFTGSPPGAPEAAFRKLNDPIVDEARIRQAVLDGYIVRTRADADTIQARNGDTATRDAALRSGAQWISTDYAVDDPRFEPVYSVKIPAGIPARCNPVRLPTGCTAHDIEDPAFLNAGR